MAPGIAVLQYAAELKAQSGDTAKLTMNALCDAYLAVRRQAPAIDEHIKNIYDEQELSPEATISKMEIVQNEGAPNQRPQETIKISPTIRPGLRSGSYSEHWCCCCVTADPATCRCSS